MCGSNFYGSDVNTVLRLVSFSEEQTLVEQDTIDHVCADYFDTNKKSKKIPSFFHNAAF